MDVPKQGAPFNSPNDLMVRFFVRYHPDKQETHAFEDMPALRLMDLGQPLGQRGEGLLDMTAHQGVHRLAGLRRGRVR